MNTLTKNDLILLLKKKNEQACLSIFLPTHPVGIANKQDQIRFRKLLHQAEHQLEVQGIDIAQAKSLLQQAKGFQLDPTFWQHQSQGLALLISPNNYRIYSLPVEFEEAVVVSDHFYVKPLLPLLSQGEDRQFYLLALSQKRVRLFEGNFYGLTEMALPATVPTNMVEALGYDQPEKLLEFHPGGQATLKTRPEAMFYGHGAINETAKEDLLHYFRLIDQGLRVALKDRKAPLVLAGVEYLLPIYHKANTYPRLFGEGITGNPDLLKAPELYRHAWRIIEPYFHKPQQMILDRYKQLIGTGLTSNRLEEIIVAAHQGRVATLFVTPGFEQWGEFRPENNHIVLREKAAPGYQELVNLAMVQTLLGGGEVYACTSEELPDKALIAMVLRF